MVVWRRQHSIAEQQHAHTPQHGECLATLIWEVATCRAGRFNERLVLSLATNPACLLMDDELNVLPTSSHVRISRSCIVAVAQVLSSCAFTRSRYSCCMICTVLSAGARHSAAATR